MTRQAQTGRIGPSTRFRRGLFILIIALLGDSRTLWAQARPAMTSVGAAAACKLFAFPVVIVNGPIAKQIRLNSGFGCLGPDPQHPAGASIGRALRLLQQNV